MDFLKHVHRWKPAKAQEFVRRDDLDKKKTAGQKVKKKVNFELKPLIQRDEECKQNSSFQVKILMTKEEAARLLSKCKNDGVLRFEDVPNLSLHIPNNPAHNFSTIKKEN